MKVFMYPAIIANELKNIKTPVAIKNRPVMIEISLMWRFNLLKCLRKVLIPILVSIKGIASPAL